MVACPFFFPTKRSFSIAWSFPNRLPLGAGFCGMCRTNGEEFAPDDATLRDFCNRAHAPAGHGTLKYDCASRRWKTTLDDACVQRQAECYLAVYLERKRGAN